MYDQNCDENDDTDLDPRIQAEEEEAGYHNTNKRPPIGEEMINEIIKSNEIKMMIELEKLNSATDKINSLEVELDEANTHFRMLLNESIKRLKLLSKKLGGCIERARPFYEALDIARKAQLECQRAAVQFQRANEIHQAAKETVALAEQRFLSKQHEWQFDNAWQEMLNHATIKVMEAETQKTESGLEHQKRAALFNQAEQKLQNLESKLRRSINKSRPYFEEKELCQRHLAAQKEQVEFLQKQVATVKNSYAMSLKKLEKISEEIHMKRGDIVRGVREPGVGAEFEAITEMDLEKLNSQYKNNEPNIINSKYAKIINPAVELFEKNAINRYYPNLEMKGAIGNHTDLDYESELDRCDLQSLGSMSATTSSAVSDEDIIEDDSEIEELKQMAAKISNKTESKNETIVNNCDIKSCRKTGNDRIENLRRFSENWEKQMSETINKLGTILSLKPKDADCCSENTEKY